MINMQNLEQILSNVKQNTQSICISPCNRDIIKDNAYLFDINVTYICNMQCSFCYNRDILKDNRMLSFSVFKKIVDNIANVIHNEPIVLHILGGEPFLDPDLYKMIKYVLNDANLNLYKIKIFTNGTCIPENIKDFLNDPRFELDIAFHAEQISYTEFIDNLKYYIINKDYHNNIHIYVYLEKDYLNDVNSILNYLITEVKHPNILLNDLQPSQVSKDVYLDFIRKWRLDNKRSILNLKIDNDIYKLYISDVFPNMFTGLTCMYKKNVFVIEPNGHIYPACGEASRTYYAYIENHIKQCIGEMNNAICNRPQCTCIDSFEYSKYNRMSRLV